MELRNLFWILLLTCFSPSNPAVAQKLSQHTPQPVFKVLRIFGDSGQNTDSVNKAIAKMTSRKELIKALRTIFIQPESATVLVRERRRNGSVSYFRQKLVESRPKEITNVAVMAGKSGALSEIEKLDDFTAVFSDTLVVLDTLKLRIRLAGGNYPTDNFYLIFRDPVSGSVGKIKIASDGDHLLLYREMFPQANGRYQVYSLRNFNDPQTNLALSSVRFLSNAEQGQLLDILQTYKTDFPQTTDSETEIFAQSLVRAVYGKGYGPNAAHFLRTHQLTGSKQ